MILVMPRTKKWNKQGAVKILLMSWFVFYFLIHAAYECNLRAYMLRASFEPVVDKGEDIVKQKRRFFFSAEYSEKSYFEALPEETFKWDKEYARISYENGWTHTFVNGFMFSQEMEKVEIEPVYTTMIP